MGSSHRAGWPSPETVKVIQWSHAFAWAIAGIAILLGTAGGVAQVVNIADPNLEQAIREELEKPVGDLTEADLQQLVRLYASHRNIATMDGFTTATNLNVLDLSYNALSSVVFTSGFPNLQYAFFHANEMTNLTATGLLPRLAQLRLSENFLTDASFLQHMPRLVYLELDYNEISDFDPGEDLQQLVWLNLAFNRIQNLDFLSRLPHLMNLFLDDNGLTNVALPAVFTNITWLTLDVNRITDLAFLSLLPSLTHLELASNLAEQYRFPEGLATLRNINLGENRLTNVVFAPDLTNLTVLYMDDNRLTELPNLLPLYSLEALDLDINQLSRIVIPYTLTNLTRVEVGFNPLDELILPEVLATNRLTNLVTELTNQGVTVRTYPVPPRLAGPKPTPTGRFEFELRGMPGTYDVHRSADLGSWSFDGGATNVTGTVGYSAPIPDSLGSTYYRVMLK